jgi:hypothetical protein
MRPISFLATFVLVIAPLPAIASSCVEQIGTIERRLDSAGAVQVFGLQAGHILRTGSLRAVNMVHTDPPSDPQAAPTADHMTKAQVLIIRASDEDRRGDQRACENTMTEAKGMIGALP